MSYHRSTLRSPALNRCCAALALLFVVALGAPEMVHAEEFAHAAVAADHPEASRIGADILRQGGNAADAAIATGLALGVLNPFASGIGGGGFLVYHDAATDTVVALDFRETAPGGAHREMFIFDGEVDRERFARGGLAVAVPGEIAGWWALHQRFGSLSWETLVEPARALAEAGFEVHPLLESRIASGAERIANHDELANMLRKDGGQWLRQGDRMTRPALARTLGEVAQSGEAAFYRGPRAEAIVSAVQAAGGILTIEDLDAYAPVWRETAPTRYEGYTLHTMPLPGSGALVMREVLGRLTGFHPTRVPPLSAVWLHALTESMIHAFALRASSMGDPTFQTQRATPQSVDIRVTASPDWYLPHRTRTPEAYGELVSTDDDDGTSHFSIVDADGNGIAVTSTINTSFGSMVFDPVTGIVFNNEMNDFSPSPGVPNEFGLVGSEANAIEPGKRPLSSMSPTLVFEDGQLVGSLGASGGPMIITATLQTVLALIHRDLSTQDAINTPRVHHQWSPFTLFADAGIPEQTLATLRRLGHDVREAPFSASVQAIWRRGDAWDAASDPAKQGAPAGY